jgi:uncharacterized protein
VILVDSNVWLDAADVDCPRHQACADLLRSRRGQLFTSALVVAESARLIRFKLGPSAEVRFLEFVTSDEVRVVDLTASDWTRSLALVGQYLDRPLGLVDASIVAIAERLSIVELATMNGRDFYLVRPKHVDAFVLYPEGLARTR